MKPNNIYEILALFYEDTRDPICIGCHDYQNQNRPDKKAICLKYEAEIMSYLKAQGIEKA